MDGVRRPQVSTVGLTKALANIGLNRSWLCVENLFVKVGGGESVRRTLVLLGPAQSNSSPKHGYFEPFMKTAVLCGLLKSSPILTRFGD
jgi:hypothetical protein